MGFFAALNCRTVAGNIMVSHSLFRQKCLIMPNSKKKKFYSASL